MADEIVFEDPPVSTMGRYGEPAWRKVLRARPGEWARLPLSGTNSTNYNARYRGEFEFTSRTVDGEHVLWGRYIGNGAK
jgi:hypothetical protein